MRIGVLTSGGDAPGMNAAIRAVVRTALYYGHDVYGIKNGYRGLIENDMVLLLHDDVSGGLTRGGTFLGTARVENFHEQDIREIAYRNLQKRKINALIVIGGDGSYRGAMALAEMGVKVVCIPGTIDNDLGGTDKTIGFNTALNTIVEAIDKLRDTSSSHQRCSIIETMGRKAGDLALYSGLCSGAEFIITNDHPVDKNYLINTLSAWQKEGRRQAIVVVTEHMFDVYELAKEITEKSGFSTRATVLGYIQRGGTPVPEDRILATQLGSYAVTLVNDGIHGVGVGIRNNKLVYNDLEYILNDLEHHLDLYDLIAKVS